MPTIATRSLMPRLAILVSFARLCGPGGAFLAVANSRASRLRPTSARVHGPRSAFQQSLALRPRLPEVVVHALTGVEPPERHLELVSDGDLLRVDVGELAGQAPA